MKSDNNRGEIENESGVVSPAHNILFIPVNKKSQRYDVSPLFQASFMSLKPISLSPHGVIELQSSIMSAPVQITPPCVLYVRVSGA